MITSRLGLMLIALSLLAPCVLIRAGESEQHWPPKMLFNSDCGRYVFYKFNAPMNEEQLCNVLNDLPGTQVDAFMPCPIFSDDQAWYPSKILEPYDGRQVPDGKYENADFERVAANIRSLNEQGIDSMKVWAARTRELGMMFIPTMRMNDIHKDYVDRWPSLRSTWERERNHLLIGEALPDWYAYKYKYTWAMNYAEPEVRARKLAIVNELCGNYDVDGMEFDFLRHWYYFKKGEEEAGIPLMNDFIRSVRKRLDEIGADQGKRLRLIVRVPSTLKMCRRVGLDVPTWIKEGLVDMVVAMDPGHLDISADVASFAELAKGTDCKIASGLEAYVQQYSRRGEERKGSTIEMLRAGAMSYWHQGADSIYFFNYDCHGAFPMRGEKRQVLEEVADPELIARKNKHYFITVHTSRRTRAEGGHHPLPTVLTTEHSQEVFEFVVGDDVESARQDSALAGMLLRIHNKTTPPMEIRLNGTKIQGNPAAGYLINEDPPVRQGKNRLELKLTPEGIQQKASLRINGIELFIDYKESTSG